MPMSLKKPPFNPYVRKFKVLSSEEKQAAIREVKRLLEVERQAKLLRRASSGKPKPN